MFDALTALIADITTALPAITVLDGPQAVFPTAQDFVVVGADDLLVQGMVTAVDNGQQEWLDLGAYHRKEQFTIASTYVAWTGATDTGAFADCRARAKASINSIGTSLRPPPAGTGDAMLNGVLNQVNVGWCGMWVGKILQVSEASLELEDGSTSQGGSAIHVPFYLDCVAYL